MASARAYTVHQYLSPFKARQESAEDLTHPSEHRLGGNVPAVSQTLGAGEVWGNHPRPREDRRAGKNTSSSEANTAPVRITALRHARRFAWEQLGYERSEAFGEETLARAREQGDSRSSTRHPR